MPGSDTAMVSERYPASPGQNWVVPDHGRFDFFASQDERHEHGLAAAIFVGWQAGQPISAINQFFYVEIQALILTGEDDF